MKTYKSKISNISLKWEKTDFKSVKISNSADGAKYARNFYFDDLMIYESVFIIFLNRQNNTTAYVKISQGGVAGTVIDPKIVGKYILDTLASSVIMIHNHPSGNTKPSQADINITKQIKEVAKICDSNLIDHIILTETEYYSFADEGLI